MVLWKRNQWQWIQTLLPSQACFCYWREHLIWASKNLLLNTVLSQCLGIILKMMLYGRYIWFCTKPMCEKKNLTAENGALLNNWDKIKQKCVRLSRFYLFGRSMFKTRIRKTPVLFLHLLINSLKTKVVII